MAKKTAKRQAKRIKKTSSKKRSKPSVAVTRADSNGHTVVSLPLLGLHEWRGHTSKRVPWEVHCGDANAVLSSMNEKRFSCVVTSPPYYWQRDYNVEGQIGQEATIKGYVTAIANVMDSVKRVLRDDGCLFLNLGDTYYSAKGKPHGKDPKNKARRFGLRAVDASGLGVPRKTAIGIPWRVALEMISRGWALRSPIVWKREGALPEPTAKDRPWRTYETVFLFARSPRYYFNRDALDGDEDVWVISDRPANSNGLHSAAFPDRLVEKCISAGCIADGEILDPFAGTGTVLRVAARNGHSSVGVDLNREFCEYTVKMLHEEKWD